MLRIGVDTGGTFTDLVLLSEGGTFVHKVRSTPGDPSLAILQGLRDLLALGCHPGGMPGLSRPDVPVSAAQWPLDLEVVHGSTVATNAVLERKGARVALVATAGFEDVLRIGRQTRRELYNFFVEDRRPLVDPALTFGVAERVAADGAVLIGLDEAGLHDLAARCAAGGVESVAVCFLHSYVNATHEERAALTLEQAGFSVSASSRVLPEYREFERWSTTVVNAYVTPIMSRYLAALEASLGGVPLSIMQSNGGSISAARARGQSVHTILSGPAAGAVGAHAVAAAAGYSRAIGFDMGGTSTDVTLIDGAIGVTTESSVGDCPVRLPIVDIHTVGAGGGSIAYVDSGGALRVGPRSAGADPGPACYGTGSELTVTDANLLLGRLDPDAFLGGRMTLDAGRARHVAADLAKRVGLDALDLARGVIRVANANMERAIRVVSVQRGFDTRDFTLVAFGGAGGMHACEIADTLDIATVMVPRDAGVLSALGMLLADMTKDYSQTVLTRTTDVDADWLAARVAPLEARAAADLAADGFDAARSRVERSLDLRYAGQSYEITVPMSPGFRAEFDRRHAQLYGYANPDRAAEVVNVRVKAVGLTRKPTLRREPVGDVQKLPEPSSIGRTWFGKRSTPTPIFRLEALAPGAGGPGPALLAGAQATIVVPPHYRFELDGYGNVITRRQKEGR
jgi:N-methylhydantoinase A/oxoprolinase/acetone carboxylase beta subunit